MFPQPIAFPDVEGVLVSHLNNLLSVPVSTRVPNPRPDAFVRVMRTGGPRDGLVVDRAQVTIECWATSSVAASDLARLARAHVGAMHGRILGGTQILTVAEFSGPANLPDPTSDQARYTWTVQVGVRGVALT